MKKILRLLGASILTASVVPMEVIACSAELEEVIGNSDAEELLLTAKNEIDIAFSNLSKNNENIFDDADYERKGTKDEVKNHFNNLPNNSVIDFGTVKKDFLDRIKTNIENDIVPALLKLNELEPLFRNISRDNILKIVEDKTTITKQGFIWNDGIIEFGVPNFNPNNFDIEMWYKIKLDLCLNLYHNDETNQQLANEHRVNYIFWFCNKGAKIKNVIFLATAEIEKGFKDTSLELQVDSENDNYTSSDIEKSKKQAIAMLKDVLRNSDVEITDIAFQTGGRLKKFDKKGTILNTMLNKKDKDSAKRYLITDFLSPFVKKFKKNLDSFIKLNKFNVKMNESKLNDFGTITITDWNIQGLTLNPYEIKYIKGRFNQTREEWKTNIATVITEILYPTTDFGMRFDMKTGGNLTVTMNPNDFDSFVRDKKTMFDVRLYFRTKINQTAKAKNVTNEGKRIKVNMDGYWDDDIKPKLTDLTYFVLKGEGTTTTLELPLKLPLNQRNAVHISYDGISFRYGSKKISNDRYGSFEKTIIKKGTTDFWN